MGAVYDDLPDHEGFGERLEDQTVVAACSCGWRDDRAHHADDDGYDAAVERWDALHAIPMLERTVPAEVAELVEQTRRALVALARERPLGARKALDEIGRWSGVLRRLLPDVDPGPPSVQERLDALVERVRRDAPRLGR